MKTKLAALARGCWLLLTAVPGWPDAPLVARVGRAFPIVFPFLVMLVLVGGKLAVLDPHLQAARAENRPLLLLEKQIASLRLNCSEQEARDLTARAAGLSRSLIGGPADLEVAVKTIQSIAAAQHWAAILRAGDGAAAPTDEAQVAFLRLKGNLTPAADNRQPFPTLVMMLDALSGGAQRIDLTRLSVRADEEGRYSVEAHLRLPYRVSHEKAAQ